MSNPTQYISDHLSSLADEARSLMSATADVAGDKVAEARKRLAAALDSGHDVVQQCKSKAVEYGKVAEKSVRSHPAQSVGIALGVGAVFGFVLRHCCSRK